MQKLALLMLLPLASCSTALHKEEAERANVESTVILKFPDIYYRGPELNTGTWPETVPGAVNTVLSTMTEKDKSVVREMQKKDLIMLHHGFGTGLRNALGLWRGNEMLLKSCKKTHPDECSMVIIVALWRDLKSPN